MGASLVYLEKPNKDINFDIGGDDKLEYVAGEMQGWRINMVSPGFKGKLKYLKRGRVLDIYCAIYKRKCFSKY